MTSWLSEASCSPALASEVPAFSWRVEQLVVEGRRYAAEGFEVDDGWLMRVALDATVTVYVEGRTGSFVWFADQHELVRTHDLEHYFEGRLELLRRQMP